ncbi:MAG TPA: hypothetical protein VJA21_11585 [Verrucomicrobiae bacterium]
MAATSKHLLRLAAVLVLGLSFWQAPTAGAADASTEGETHRLVPAAKDLNTPRDFPAISSRREWNERARYIHDHVLFSCGLWPLPDKTPLNTRVFGRIERGDYSIEKVYFETYPGFFLAGNLYRPLGKGKGPFPAILNPHGHWSNGRMADEKDGSIAARCITFARQGMLAFSYDMVGYNDSHFAGTQSNTHRQFGTNRADLLWNISLMGLQTWNSIRALDFLRSLSDADPKRLACTGESGGGTQTFILGAVDDRLALQAPIVMVSHTMQGGCLCENAPGLRVQFSNMEIAAVPAPRPQMLVAATGDWTKDTLNVEGPAIAHIYRLLGAPQRFHFVRFDFGHNYNQTSREAVYGWFNKWLRHGSSFDPIAEQPYHKEPDSDLRVFPDGRLPAGALTQDEFIQSLRRMHRNQSEALAPRNAAGLKEFSKTMFPAWRHCLQLDPPEVNFVPRVAQAELRTDGEFSTASVTISRPGEEAPVTATYWAPAGILKERSPRLVVISGNTNAASLAGLPLELLRRGAAVLMIDRFSTAEPGDQFSNFYCTYNRTQLQNRVRDLLLVCSAAKSVDPRKTIPFRVTLAGCGMAGLWSLMAAPGAEAVAADCAGLDTSDEQAFLASELFCPGVLALGGFETAALLAAPHPLLLHNTGGKFGIGVITQAYSGTKTAAKFAHQSVCLSGTELAAWICAQ